MLIRVSWTPALVSDEGDDDWSEFLRECTWCGTIFDPGDPPTRRRTCSDQCRKDSRAYVAAEGRRRRRERMSAPGAEVFGRIEIFERDLWMCGLCGVVVDPLLRLPDMGTASLDHIVPIARGGAHTRANVQLAHMKCNAIKALGPPWARHTQ